MLRQLLHSRQSSMSPESTIHWPATGLEADTLANNRPPTSHPFSKPATTIQDMIPNVKLAGTMDTVQLLAWL